MQRTRLGRILGCLLVLGPEACSGVGAGEIARRGAAFTDDGAQMQGTQMQGMQMQGAQMQGMQMQGFVLGSLTLRGQSLMDVRVAAGGLVALQGSRTLRGTDLLDARLIGEALDTSAEPPTTVEVAFRIAAVQADDTVLASSQPGDTWLYEVEQRNPETGEWVSACTPDAAGSRRAIPIGAVFDASGARVESRALFTLACTSGVIAKCYRWGYRPWLADPADPGLAARVHWACTRLARADYCGNGASHTHDGTLVNVWDDLGPPLGPIQTHGAPIAGMVFEAGWDTGGAVCLSKQRWLTLAPDVAAACPERLVAPGVGVDGATVCDDADVASASGSDVRLFDESMLNL